MNVTRLTFITFIVFFGTIKTSDHPQSPTHKRTGSKGTDLTTMGTIGTKTGIEGERNTDTPQPSNAAVMAAHFEEIAKRATATPTSWD